MKTGLSGDFIRLYLLPWDLCKKQPQAPATGQVSSMPSMLIHYSLTSDNMLGKIFCFFAIIPNCVTLW